MNSINAQNSGKKGKDILITIFFYLSTFRMSRLTIGQRDFFESDWINSKIFQFSFDWSRPVSVPVFVSVTLIVGSRLFFLFLSFRRKKRLSLISLSIFIVFLLYRAGSLFSFPYGSLQYPIYSNTGVRVKSFSYPGFTLYDRFSSFFFESLFSAYFLFAFNYIKRLPLPAKKVSILLLKAFILFGISLILYSICREQEERKDSIDHLIHSDPSFFTSVKSFTSHKNVAGFYIFLSCLACLYLFSRKENWVYPLIYIINLVYLVILQSRTPLILSLIAGILLSLLYPVFRFRKQKGKSIFFLTFFLLLLLSLIILYTLKTEEIKTIIQAFLNKGTVHSRMSLIDTALDLLKNHNRFFFTGRGETPYAFLLIAYRKFLAAPDMVFHTSHCVYIDILRTKGIFSLLLCLGLLFSLFVFVFKRRRKGSRKAPTLFLILLTTSIYSQREPRGLFLREGNCSFFILLVLLPILRDSSSEHRRSILTKGLRL